MSKAGEARYGRACLLVLNICPFTLKKVIDDFYTRNGYPSLQNFLDKHKHDLFHLLLKSCCCRSEESKVTPMHISQWVLLYDKNAKPCNKGHTDDCPCQYDAKPGITTEAMDVTLCCLVIYNICPGVNMKHIRTIRKIRNDLIHAKHATLDEITLRDYWEKVDKAISGLARHVVSSPTVLMETRKLMKELQTRVMDSHELGELRKLTLDQKKFAELEEKVEQAQGDIGQLQATVEDHARQIDDQGRQIDDQGRQIDDQGRQIDDQGRQIDDHDRQIDDQGRQIDDQGRQIDDQGRQIDDQGRQIDDQGRQIDDQGRQIDDQGRQIDDHDRQIDDQGRQIDDHDRQIDDQGRQIDDQGRQIDDHGRQIQIHAQNIEDIKLQISTGKTPSKLEEDPAINILRQKLYKINHAETKRIPVSPLQKTSCLPLADIYAPVSIREDLEYKGKGRNMGRETAGKRTKLVKLPEDIFYIDGDLTRNAFMLGDAAHGKSVFCLRLVEDWCKAKSPSGKKSELGEWENALNTFDFLFLIQLRHVDQSRTAVIDMICHDVFQYYPSCRETIRDVLSSENYQCLIVIDGLDEWNISEELKRKLKIEGLPNTDDMACCTFFWTSRPWQFDEISDVIRSHDRVLEINGLDIAGIDTVIEKILVNFYEIDKKSDEFEMKYKEIKKKSQDIKLKSLMQIPLMAIACVQIWFEKKSVGESMKSLYVALLDMLIRRLFKKKQILRDWGKRHNTPSSDGTALPRPQILADNESTKDFIPVLMKLGKVAYEDLVLNETHLVFRAKDLEKHIGKSELEFALNTGLLSQCEAPGTFNEENVSVNFFHKSVEEFLAAIYIETRDDLSKSFCAKLTSVKSILELGNVLIFLSGLSPTVGCFASYKILNATCGDEEIILYREFSTLNRNNKVELLYKTLASCYREMKHGIARTDSTEGPLTFHVSDVFLNDYSDTDAIQATSEILRHHHFDIASLYLWNLTADATNEISDTVLAQFLDQTVSLQSICMSCRKMDRVIHKISDRFSFLTAIVLYSVTFSPDALSDLQKRLQSNKVLKTFGLIDIKCLDKKEEVECREHASLQGFIKILPDLASLSTLYIRIMHVDDKQRLVDVLSHLGHLRSFCYDGASPPDEKYDSEVVQTLCSWSELRILNLGQMTLEDDRLIFRPSMDKLEEVMLWRVVMSTTAWERFIQSIIDIKHEFGLKVIGNDIEEKICPTIRSSSHFKVTYDGMDGNGDNRFYCIKQIPQTPETVS